MLLGSPSQERGEGAAATMRRLVYIIGVTAAWQRYDEGSDRFVKGKWSGATKGKWEAERSEPAQPTEGGLQEQPAEDQQVRPS